MERACNTRLLIDLNTGLFFVVVIFLLFKMKQKMAETKVICGVLNYKRLSSGYFILD